MDIEKLKALEAAAYMFSGYLCNLVELETTPNLIVPRGFTRESYAEHLANMIGGYRQALGDAYNAIPEWRNI